MLIYLIIGTDNLDEEQYSEDSQEVDSNEVQYSEDCEEVDRNEVQYSEDCEEVDRNEVQESVGQEDEGIPPTLLPTLPSP